MTRDSILLTVLIGQTFLWTGSAFMSVLYRLYAVCDPACALLLTESLYYVLQAAGIAAFALVLRCAPRVADGRLFAPAAVVVTGAFTLLALLTSGVAAVATWGALMNLGVGVLSGVYLTRLTSGVAQQERGRVFGCSYAIGSVGTFLLSLPCDGAFLRTDGALWVFAALVVLSVVLTRFLEPMCGASRGGESAGAGAGSVGCEDEATGVLGRRLVLLALGVPFLCSVANGMGGYFAAADLSGTLDPAVTRAFYGVGLVAAGFINDRNRRQGAVCCLVALVFPFMSLALRGEVGAAVFLSVVGYVFYGFFSVYRVVLFADLAGRESGLLWIAVFGLAAGRVGDAAGTLAGVLLGGSQLALTCSTAAVFIVATLVFFRLYHRLYLPRAVERKSAEALLGDFEVRHGLTARQCEILRLAVSGRSNVEISAELFLSESTVKFHMKNILKKTGCTNRTELRAAISGEAGR